MRLQFRQIAFGFPDVQSRELRRLVASVVSEVLQVSVLALHLAELAISGNASVARRMRAEMFISVLGEIGLYIVHRCIEGDRQLPIDSGLGSSVQEVVNLLISLRFGYMLVSGRHRNYPLRAKTTFAEDEISPGLPWEDTRLKSKLVSGKASMIANCFSKILSRTSAEG